jgi:hypothetical protein
VSVTKNLRSGLIIASLMVAAGYLAFGPLIHRFPWAIALAAIVLVLLVVGLFVLRTSDIEKPEEALSHPQPELPVEDDLFDAYTSLWDVYGETTLGLFVTMLVGPLKYLERINESAELQTDSPRLRLATRQVFFLDPEDGAPRTLPETLLLPLVRLEKGTLMDNFHVYDEVHESISTLSNNRVRGLLIYALHSSAAIALKSAGKPADTDISPQLKLLGDAICGPGPRSKKHGPDAKRMDDALAVIKDLPFEPKWKQRITRFCEMYIDNYIIVAEIGKPIRPHFNITYSSKIPLDSPTSHPLNQWRERFGLNPSTIDVVLHPFAFGVDAYHLQIDAPSEQYVFDHHLEDIDSRNAVNQANLRNQGLSPYARVYQNEARPNAHLYIRRQVADSSRPGDLDDVVVPNLKLKSVVQFREVPPGALGGATAVACASAAIISFFALTGLGFARHGTVQTVPSDIPALLLAMPAFVGALIGRSIDLSQLRRASLTTYLALTGTMALSLASSLLYLMTASRPLKTGILLTTAGGLRLHTDWLWLIFTVIAVTHALFLIRQVISESRYYFDLVRTRVLKQT